MTFTEAALEILKREGKPLHFKELTERAMTKKLLTFVGRTPEVTMQTQLTAAVKKAPGNPFVRVKPGIFGLLRYPEMPPEEKEREAPPARAETAKAEKADKAKDDKREERKRPERRATEGGDEERGRRRRRRGGRGRGGATETVAARPGAATAVAADEDTAVGRSREAAEPSEDADEPSAGGLSAEARAAALAETGVLEGDDEMTSADQADDDDDDGDDGDEDEDAAARQGGGTNVRAPEAKSGDSGPLTARRNDERGAPGDADADGDADLGEDDDGDGGAFGTAEAGDGAKAADGDDPARRRRRRRRRRRGGGPEGEFTESGDGPRPDRAAGDAQAAGRDSAPLSSENGSEAAGGAAGDLAPSAEQGGPAGQAARRIMTPVDAAIEILRAQPPGRGVHVRQIADSAIRRRLIHGEPNEAWRVIRTSLAAEPKDRLRNGMRPRVRAAGSGLYALARRTPDPELEKAEQVFGEARRALRERTLAALEKRITELPSGAFEALARVLLQREGLGPTTFVKRVEGTIYVEALRGRGSRPSKCLVALRAGGSSAGRRAIGELRAGIRARGQDEGLLMLAGRLAEDAISEWKQSGSPLEIADGAAMAETCARHGVGVLPAVLNVDFVDADFFAELAEG